MPAAMSDCSEDDRWSDWEDSTQSIPCLICSETSPSLQEIVLHLMASHEFNLPEIIEKLDLDFYGQVKLINYMRYSTSHGVTVSQERLLNPDVSVSKRDVWLDAETYLTTRVLQDDPLIYLLEELNENESSAMDQDGTTKISSRLSALSLTNQGSTASMDSSKDCTNCTIYKAKLNVAIQRAQTAEDKCQQLVQALQDYKAMVQETLAKDHGIDISNI